MNIHMQETVVQQCNFAFSYDTKGHDEKFVRLVINDTPICNSCSV